MGAAAAAEAEVLSLTEGAAEKDGAEETPRDARLEEAVGAAEEEEATEPIGTRSRQLLR